MLAQWWERWTGDPKFEGLNPIRSTGKTLSFFPSQKVVPTRLSIHLSIYLSTYLSLSISLSIYLSISLSFFPRFFSSLFFSFFLLPPCRIHPCRVTSFSLSSLDISKLDLCESGSFSPMSMIFKSDSNLSVYQILCFISVCPFVAL